MSRESAYALATDAHAGSGSPFTACDFQVHWAPFGRWVEGCKTGYFVSFLGVLK